MRTATNTFSRTQQQYTHRCTDTVTHGTPQPPPPRASACDSSTTHPVPSCHLLFDVLRPTYDLPTTYDHDNTVTNLPPSFLPFVFYTYVFMDRIVQTTLFINHNSRTASTCRLPDRRFTYRIHFQSCTNNINTHTIKDAVPDDIHSCIYFVLVNHSVYSILRQPHFPSMYTTPMYSCLRCYVRRGS